jgi:hypothetical protein
MNNEDLRTECADLEDWLREKRAEAVKGARECREFLDKEGRDPDLELPESELEPFRKALPDYAATIKAVDEVLADLPAEVKARLEKLKAGKARVESVAEGTEWLQD